MDTSLITDQLLKAAPVLCGFKVLPPVVLVERLGEGAMGNVYRGRHLNLDIDVAVKCLKAELLAQNPEYVARFQREAKIAASISQENLVRVLDTLQDYNCCYTVMEFVDGETIEGRVIRKGPLTVQESLSIMLPAVRALASLHGAKIVHRDIKPPNIMVSQSGIVKLTDLGIAKEEENKGGTLQTNPQAVMGTPQYMPPEQFENTFSVNDRADIYAMGATLAFMLLGNHAIQGASMHEILKKVCVHGFPPLRELNPTIPDSVCEIVRRCTLQDPKQRPDVRTLMQEVRQLLYAELGGEIGLEDNNASRSYGTGSMPSRLDRHAVQQIKAAITQSRPTNAAVAGAIGSMTSQSVPQTIIEQPKGTYVPPGRKKKSPVAAILVTLVLLGVVGAVGAAATIMFYPPAKAWALNLVGQKTDNGNSTNGGNSSGGPGAGGGSTTTTSGDNGGTTSTGANGGPEGNGHTGGDHGGTSFVDHHDPVPTPILFESIEAPQIIAGQSSGAIPLRMSGYTGKPSDLKFDAHSENDAIVPTSSIKVDSSGSAPAISFGTGSKTGSTFIALHASKGTEAAGDLRLPVTVVAAKRRPTIAPIGPQETQVNQSTGNLRVLHVADEDTPLEQLTLTITSDNPALLPDSSSIMYDIEKAPQWIRITPATDKDGQARVRIVVTDPDGLTAETSFTVSVIRVAKPPTIAPIADLSRRQRDTQPSLIRLKIADEDTPANDLKVTAACDNEQLVPAAGLVIAKPARAGEDWSLTVTPIAGTAGRARITVTVTDGTTPPISGSFGLVVDKPTQSELFADALAGATASARNQDWQKFFDGLEDACRNVSTDDQRNQLSTIASNGLGEFRRANPKLKARQQKYPQIAGALGQLADTRNREFSPVAALVMVEQLVSYTDEDCITISPDLKVETARQIMIYAKSAYEDPLNPQYDACVHAALVQRFIPFNDEQKAKESVRVQLALDCLQPALNASNFNNGDAAAWASVFYGTLAFQAYHTNGDKETIESATLANKADAMLQLSVDKGSPIGLLRMGMKEIKLADDLEKRGSQDVQRIRDLRSSGMKHLQAAANKGFAAGQRAFADMKQKLAGKY